MKKGKPQRDQGSTESRPTRRKDKGGRPAKITIAVVQQVGELMALGVPEAYACELHGVNPETFGPAVSRKPEFKRAMMVHHAKFMVRLGKACISGGEWVPVLNRHGDPVFDEREVQIMRHVPWQGMMALAERRYKPFYNRTEVHKPNEGKGESGGLMSAEEMADLERMTKALVASLDKPAAGGKSTTDKH